MSAPLVVLPLFDRKSSKRNERERGVNRKDVPASAMCSRMVAAERRLTTGPSVVSCSRGSPSLYPCGSQSTIHISYHPRPESEGTESAGFPERTHLDDLDDFLDKAIVHRFVHVHAFDPAATLARVEHRCKARRKHESVEENTKEKAGSVREKRRTAVDNVFGSISRVRVFSDDGSSIERQKDKVGDQQVRRIPAELLRLSPPLSPRTKKEDKTTRHSPSLTYAASFPPNSNPTDLNTAGPCASAAARAAVFSTRLPFCTEPVKETKGTRGCATRWSICEGLRCNVCGSGGVGVGVVTGPGVQRSSQRLKERERL